MWSTVPGLWIRNAWHTSVIIRLILGSAPARLLRKPPALAATTTPLRTKIRDAVAMAASTAAPGGRPGMRRRITRLSPSTITARNIAISSGLRMSASQRRAATDRITAMTTKALRDMADVVIGCIAEGNAFREPAGAQFGREAGRVNYRTFSLSLLRGIRAKG